MNETIVAYVGPSVTATVAWQPLGELRFVWRREPIGDGTEIKVKVLQQAWAPRSGGCIDWRDVPTVEEGA
jgi:hypothetical protein